MTALNPRHQRSPKNLTLNDVFPGWYTHVGPPGTDIPGFGGVFRTTTATTSVEGWNFPWEEAMTLPEILSFNSSLDYVYHGVRSGSKFITEFLYHGLTTQFPNFNSGIPFYNAPIALVTMLRAYYLDKWNHLWDDYTAEYSALHSYNITEAESTTETETTTPDITDTTTLTDSSSDTENETRTPNITEGLQIAGSGTRTPNLAENETVIETRNTTDETTFGKANTIEGESTENDTVSVYGFNSSQAVPKEARSAHKVNGQTSTDSGKDTVKGTGSITTGRQSAQTGTEGNSYTESSNKQTTGTEQISRTTTRQRAGGNTVRKTGTERVSGSRSSTRSKVGNIFKSPAELLQADREFWMTHYFEIIFDDVDKLLTLPIFSEKDVNFKVY